MTINSYIKEHYGIGVYRQNLFRPSFRFMNNYFGYKELVGIEIGTYKGINAKKILDNMNIKKLILIDPWENYSEYTDYNEKELSKLYDMFNTVKNKMKNYPTEIIKNFSHSAVNRIKDDSVDFVYIDGNHDYKYIKQDIKDYYPKIKDGGILSGHDINHPGVLNAVCEFSSENNIRLHCRENDWWLIKNGKQ